jgi:hypothetical protein
MRVANLLFFFPVCFICILSCASVAKNNQPYANLTDRSKFFLLPPGGIEQAMDMAQYMAMEVRGQKIFFNAWVKADENAIDMFLFNELGANMGELSYRDSAVHFSSAVIPKEAMRFFKPEQIVADFQLCFYDPFLLAKSLKDCGLVLEIEDDSLSGTGSRRILNKNKVIIEIMKTENSVRLENHLRGYTYTMAGDFL